MLRSWLLFAAAAFAHGVRVAPSMMPRAPTCAICMTDLALELPTTSATDDAVEDWSTWLMKARYARLRDIARSISIRRTVDEAELALKLSSEYQSDPTILQVSVPVRARLPRVLPLGPLSNAPPSDST